MTTNALPKFKCHKLVSAAAIESINADSVDLNVPGVNVYVRVHVGHDWIDENNPVLGGYFIQYEEGLQTYCSADAFESGYSLVGDIQPDFACSNQASFDYVGEAKRQALSNILSGLGGTDIEIKAVDAAKAVNAAFDKLEGTSQPAIVPTGVGCVIVKEGDTLYGIAESLYGDGWQWPLIFAINRGTIEHPNHIEPGQTLLVPLKIDTRTQPSPPKGF